LNDVGFTFYKLPHLSLILLNRSNVEDEVNAIVKALPYTSNQTMRLLKSVKQLTKHCAVPHLKILSSKTLPLPTTHLALNAGNDL